MAQLYEGESGFFSTFREIRKAYKTMKNTTPKTKALHLSVFASSYDGLRDDVRQAGMLMLKQRPTAGKQLQKIFNDLGAANLCALSDRKLKRALSAIALKLHEFTKR